MSPGFLGSEGLVAGSKWYMERTRLGFGGEELAATSGFGMVYIAGYRCRDCKLLILNYGAPSAEPGEATGPAESSTAAVGAPVAPLSPAH